MVSNIAHHITKYVSLANYPWHQRAKVIFSQLIHHKHSKTSLRTSNRTAALLTDETQEFALIKVEKNAKTKHETLYQEKKIITVGRCDQSIHWQHKYLDCITILCSL